ncbi:RING finger protein [Anatilimnocola sp. NA78]|uniref:RING finger protein n=1 Tax=Anatilimnocola sp. NA78 TaxID=3415683 RepID=UPI003CE457F8
MAAIAARWHGHVEQGDWFHFPQVVLRIGNTAARLQFFRENKRSSTCLTIHFPDPHLRLEIYPQTIVHGVGKLLGMQDIEIGSRHFDDAFIIQGNSAAILREYLTFESQAAIQELAACTFFHNLHLTIGGGTFRVTKSGILTGETELLKLIPAFERLFLALLDARTTGIEYLPTVAPARVIDTQCRVCGDALAGKIVYCASCLTPHHLDCWNYFGSCSVYACGQKKYRHPRS